MFLLNADFHPKATPVESTAVPLAPIMTICQRYVNAEETAAVIKISPGTDTYLYNNYYIGQI